MKISNSSIYLVLFSILFIYLILPIQSKSITNSIRINNDNSNSLNIFLNNSINNNHNNSNVKFKPDYNYEFLIRHLTTKTPYYSKSSINNSFNKNNNLNSSNSLNSIKNGTCKLISMDLLVRHGSRYPEIKIINRMNKLMKDISEFNNSIGDEFKWLKSYQVPYKKEMAGNLLVELGGEELYNISKRMLLRFPGYFEQYNPQKYMVQSTIVSRTGISASSFTYGLFEGTGKLHHFQPVHIQTSSIDKDNLLCFFLNCKKYVDLIKNGTINENQEEEWKNLKYPSIAQEISQRLGLSGKWVPSNSNVQSIFLSCVYQVAIDNITDQFCSLLSKSNLLDWEYSKDLSTYWTNGFGNPINYEISSSLFKDIFNHFDSIINTNNSGGNINSNSGENDLLDDIEEKTNDGKPSKNVFRFGHSETLVSFMSLLGLFKDNYHLFANSTTYQINNRVFKTSEIVPYATNIGFYLYECGNNQDFKILVEHNELPIKIPGCDEIMCSYQKFKSLYPKVVNFNWDSYCNDDTNNNTNFTSNKK